MLYAIDFGTSNSLLCAATREEVLGPIPLERSPAPGQDPTVLRTLLYFPSMKQVYYGREAITHFTQNDFEGRLIRSIKRQLPVRSFVGTFVDERPVNLEDLISFFLAEMKRRADAHFGADVRAVLLGCPARFSENAEDDAFAQYRLERAARLAGFERIHFCPEPLAAAYDFRQEMKRPHLVLVADYGGGTSDFTVVRLNPVDSADGFDARRDVLAIDGVPLAGDALDGSVMREKISPYFGSQVEYRVPFGSNVIKMPRLLMEKICSPTEISLLRRRDTLEFFKNVREWSLGGDDRQKMDRLFCLLEDQLGFEVFEVIERCKRALSDAGQTEFRVDYPGIEIAMPLTRDEFDRFTQPPRDRIIEALDRTLAKAGVPASEIDLVCSTGGTAKVPAIHAAMVERFGSAKILEHRHFHSVVGGLGKRAREILREGAI